MSIATTSTFGRINMGKGSDFLKITETGMESGKECGRGNEVYIVSQKFIKCKKF